MIAQREHLESIFDPVYRERIALISARSPEQDAKVILNEGHAFYFPATLDEFSQFDIGPVYPGVNNLLSENREETENYKSATECELGMYL